MSTGYGFVSLAAAPPLTTDYPATAAGVLASFHVGEDDEARRVGPAAVFLSLTAREPMFEFEDVPEPVACGYLTPDAADGLARMLIDYAAVSRGSKPAQYLTRRDTVVIDGGDHDVVRVVVDADNGVSVYTRQGGRRKPAGRYHDGELVKLANPEGGGPR